MVKRKAYRMTEELARKVVRLIQQDQLLAASTFTKDNTRASDREIIDCIVHQDIEGSGQKVPCTRLVTIPDRGSKKAWQVVVPAEQIIPFRITVNGTSLGPFDSTTTTSQFRTALNTLSNPKPDGQVIHGNFFIYPAATVTVSEKSPAEVFEVPWKPLVTTGETFQVGYSHPSSTVKIRRGETHRAHGIWGYGFSISGRVGERLQVVYREDLQPAIHTEHNPAEAYASVYRRDDEGNLRRTPVKYLVVNRLKGVFLDAWAYGKIEWIDGEWQPYVGDCPGETQSSDSFG